jgi:hypothetical protein
VATILVVPSQVIPCGLGILSSSTSWKVTELHGHISLGAYVMYKGSFFVECINILVLKA